MLTLENFEEQVNEPILQRGKKYYQNGAIIGVEETEKNCWQAEVAGSDTYSVELKLTKKSTIKEYFCDCPYDGGTCKHTVAVFYAIREEIGKPGYTQSKASPKLVFENILQKINLKESQAFIRQYASKNKNFTTAFELWFSDKDDRVNVGKKYADIIQDLIRNYTNRGYVDYRATFGLSKDVDKLIDAGYDSVNKKNLRDAFALAKPVLKEIMGVITYCDDSAGNIGGTIDHAIRLIEAISEANETAPELKEEVFDFLQTELDNKLYFDYGDFGYELFTVFERLAVKLNKAEEFLHFIDAQFIQLTGEYSEYRNDFFHTQKIEFLQATGRIDEAEKLVRQNLDIVEVRQGVVHKAIHKKDFFTAKKLIAGGIKIAEEKKHPGTVMQWEQVLLKIAVLENDSERVRYYTKRFAFDRWFNKEYYIQWKKTYSKSEWKEVIEKYIDDEIKKITRT